MLFIDGTDATGMTRMPTPGNYYYQPRDICIARSKARLY